MYCIYACAFDQLMYSTDFLYLSPHVQIHNFVIQCMNFLHLSRSVLKIELGGTDLFHNVKIQISHNFPSIFPIFHQFSLDFHLQKSMILSLKWVAQHIIWGTCWFYIFCTFIFSCQKRLCTIAVVRSRGGTDTYIKINGICIVPRSYSCMHTRSTYAY